MFGGMSYAARAARRMPNQIERSKTMYKYKGQTFIHIPTGERVKYLKREKMRTEYHIVKRPNGEEITVASGNLRRPPEG